MKDCLERSTRSLGPDNTFTKGIAEWIESWDIWDNEERPVKEEEEDEGGDGEGEGEEKDQDSEHQIVFLWANDI